MATYKHDPNTEDVLDSSEDEEDNSSRFASVRGHMSSVRSNESSRPSISSFFTVKGSNDKESNVYCEIEDADAIDKTDHQPFIGHINRTEVDIIQEKNEKLCFKCKTEEATHFCRTCRYGRQYMCYVCLKGHDDWLDGHAVVILSVEIEGNLGQQPEDLDKLGMSKEANFNHLKTSKIFRQPLNVDSDDHDDENEGQNTENEMPPYKEGQSISKRFYKDEFYPSIAHELRTKQRCRTDGQLQKYGMYSIRTSSDTKTCAITGIVQLENEKMLLADSENCNLKILNEETFKIIVSRELPSNPYLMSFAKENKVIIACINSEFYLVDFEDDKDIQKLFEIKHLFKCIAFARDEVWGCTSDTIEVYSVTGTEISKFKPTGVTNIEDMCVSKEGDIIYCADEKKGIVAINKHGTVVDIISENLCKPHRVCLSPEGYIFVTEKNTDRVMKVDIQRKDAIQIGREDVYTNNSPISLCHEKTNNRLIVALWQSDKIHVYTCP